MSEAFGAAVRRKNALHLTPILHHPHPVRSWKSQGKWS
jgi:hypothetical protein